NREKFTPRPSQVAPSGEGCPRSIRVRRRRGWARVPGRESDDTRSFTLAGEWRQYETPCDFHAVQRARIPSRLSAGYRIGRRRTAASGRHAVRERQVLAAPRPPADPTPTVTWRAIPSPVTVHTLETRLTWAPIRDHPEFQALL